MFKLGSPMHTCFVHHKDNVHVWSGHLCHHISCLSLPFNISSNHPLSPYLIVTFFAFQLCFDIQIKLLIDFFYYKVLVKQQPCPLSLQQWFLPMTQTWQFKDCGHRATSFLLAFLDQCWFLPRCMLQVLEVWSTSLSMANMK